MSKKPQKVGEPTTPYAAKKPAERKTAPKPVELGAQQVDDASFKKIANRIFSERKELLHKLAQ